MGSSNGGMCSEIFWVLYVYLEGVAWVRSSGCLIFGLAMYRFWGVVGGIRMAFLVGMKVLGAALCIMPLGGCALGIGLVFSGLLYGVCRNPDAYDSAFGAALLGLAMIEVFAFLSLIAAIAVFYA